MCLGVAMLAHPCMDAGCSNESCMRKKNVFACCIVESRSNWVRYVVSGAMHQSAQAYKHLRKASTYIDIHTILGLV